MRQCSPGAMTLLNLPQSSTIPASISLIHTKHKQDEHDMMYVCFVDTVPRMSWRFPIFLLEKNYRDVSQVSQEASTSPMNGDEGVSSACCVEKGSATVGLSIFSGRKRQKKSVNLPLFFHYRKMSFLYVFLTLHTSDERALSTLLLFLFPCLRCCLAVSTTFLLCRGRGKKPSTNER